MTEAAPVDIAIVGGGVAGCAAALSLHRSGRSVTMLVPVSRPRDGNGEMLSPMADAILQDLGVGRLFAEVPHRLASASYAAWETPLLAQRHAIAQADGAGRIIDRAAFERMLCQAASRTSFSRSDVALRCARRHPDGWSLDLSDGRIVTARHVLDCSGRAAVFARHLSRRRRADQLVAASCILPQTMDGIKPTAATLIEAVADGWWYAVLLPDGRLGLLFFSDPDLLPHGLSRDAALWSQLVERTHLIRRWVESAGIALDTPPRLQSAATTWLDPAGGADWTAAGDAAAAFDPLSSHGLTTALWGGRQAARAALARLNGDDGPASSYAQTIAEAMRSFLAQQRAIYSRPWRFRDAPFWRRRAAGRSFASRPAAQPGLASAGRPGSPRWTMDSPVGRDSQQNLT